MTTIRLYDQNHILLGVLEASQWSYVRKISEATEISVTCPIDQPENMLNSNEMLSMLSSYQPAEVDEETALTTGLDKELAYYLEIYKDTRKLVSGIISKRDFTDTSVTLKALTEETLLTRYLSPSQYGRKYENWDIQDIANDLSRAWLVQRVKAKSQWDEGTKVNVDTATEPGMVLLSKSGAYNASGSITLTFNKPANWAVWERIRWSGDYDSVVATKMQYSTDGGSTWSIEYIGGEPDTLGIEIADTSASTVMVRINLTTSDTTSQDNEGNPTGVTPRLFAVEVISRTAPYFTVSSISGLACKGLEVDNATPLAILQAACSQIGKEFYLDNNQLFVGIMGTDRHNEVFLRKSTNMIITQLGDELAEVYNVIHATGSGSGINRLEITRSDATSMSSYGVREKVEEFDTEDLDELTALADAFLEEHKEPFYAWKVKAMYPPDEEPAFECGDWITVSDKNIVTQARIEQLERQSTGGVSLYLNKTRAGLAIMPKPSYADLSTLERPVAMSVYPVIKGIVAVVSRPVDASRWDYTELHISTVASFVPTVATLHSQRRATLFEIGNLDIGTRYYLRAIHVAKDGTKSNASDERSCVPLAITPGDTEGIGSIVLNKSPDSIIISARGQLKTSQVVFTVALTGLALGTLSWTRSDGGDLEPYEIEEGVYDPYSMILDCSTVVDDSITVAVEMSLGSNVYNAIQSISRISEGEPMPEPLGAVSTLPTELPDGEPLMIGDHFTWDGEDTADFLWGHSYAYAGKDGLGNDLWEETDNFVFLSNLAKDNIEMSKREGEITHSRLIFTEYLFATKIEVLDELVANFKEYKVTDIGKTIDGHLVTADDVGKIYSGSRIGADGKIRAIDGEFWNTVLHGLIKSDALDTQDENTSVAPISATAPSLSLWNEKRLYDLFPVNSSQYLQTAVFDWGGESYTKATKLSNQKVIYDRVTGPTNGRWGTGDLTQIGDDYIVPSGLPSNTFEIEVDWGWTTFVLLVNSYIEVWRGGVLLSTIERSTNSQRKVTLINMQAGDVIKCFVDWGLGYIELIRRHIEVRTRSSFTGIVGLRADNYIYTLPIAQDTSRWHSWSWSGAGVSTSSILDKTSGTDIVDACAGLGADFVQCSGTLTYESVPYVVDRIRKEGDSVYFYSGARVFTIDSFVDGTATGTYTPTLSISQITIYSQLPACLVRYLIPKEHASYDLGQSGVVTPSGPVDRFFRNLYLSGIAYADKVNTGHGDCEAFPMDQGVQTTDSPSFSGLTLSGGLTVSGDLIENSPSQWALGSQRINASSSYILPRGTYVFCKLDWEDPDHASVNFQVKDSSAWNNLSSVLLGATYSSDGTNMRLTNSDPDYYATVYWRKKP